MTITTKLLVKVTEIRTFERVVEVDQDRAVDITYRDSEDQLGELFNGCKPSFSQWQDGEVSEVADSVPVTLSAADLPADSPLRIASEALAMAYEECGWDSFNAAKQHLENMISQLLLHDQKLNDEQLPPMGDDYNELRSIMGLV